MSSRDAPVSCDRARELLWPPEQPRLAESDVVEARHHVDGCPDCREYFTQDEVLLSSYQRLRQEAAPRGVRERVFDVLARERARPTDGAGVEPAWRRRSTWITGSVAAIAAVFVATSSVILKQPAGPPAEVGGTMFVQDYLRRAVGEDQITTSDPEAVKRFLVRELGQALAPLEGGGLVLTRAEICLLEGRRGAMIIYDRDGRTISHYLVPAEDGVARAPARAEPVDGVEDVGALAVVTWSSSSLEQALVGAVPSELLLSLARNASAAD